MPQLHGLSGGLLQLVLAQGVAEPIFGKGMRRSAFQ